MLDSSVSASKRLRPRRILLVGWDAADWSVIHPLLDSGQMPTLSGLIDGGVMGNLSTLHPMISPMLWNSIATGKTADKHGICGFAEPDPMVGFRPVSSVSRRTKAIWNIFQQALGWRCNVVGWWASHPAEPLNGHVVTDYFLRTRRVADNRWEMPLHAVHPENRAAEFAPLRMMPNEVTEDLVLPFIPRGAEIDQESENGLESFAGLLSECCSIQNAVTTAMEMAPWEFTAVYFDSIDHFSHAFMPFHPPRQAHVSEEAFELYKGVITGIYRFHDMMLARLLELAGPDTLVLVCSDHGFQSGDLRPLGSPNEPAGPTFWHRDYGMFVLNGPGVRRDERIYGATLLDLTPTLLTLAGLPIGEDMDGKPLLDALEDPTLPPKIASWDEVSGDHGGHPAGFKWTAPAQEAQEMMKQMAALGYVDDPSADRKATAESVELEIRYNLVQVHLSAGRAETAVPIMESLVHARPWESRYLHQLANAYVKGGYYRAADELLTAAYPTDSGAEVPAIVWLMHARAKLRRGHREAAVACLGQMLRTMRRHPPLWVEAGLLALELHEIGPAEACFRRALELDPECARAWEGLAVVLLRKRDNLSAIDAALEAIQLLFHLPHTHFNLGVALAREGRHDEAIVAFRRALAMRPSMPHVHRWLAALLSLQDENSFLAGSHPPEASRQSRDRIFESATKKARAVETRPLPAIPSPAAREAEANKRRPRHVAPNESNHARKNFIIVSGLPRSGTSLMMKMLAAGGLPPHTDGQREPDPDNPGGYFEWDAIKRIGKQPELLDEPGLESKAIKVISALLPQLPQQHHYRVLFMRRAPEEIAVSQAKMMAHRGTKGIEEDEGTVVRRLAIHRDETLRFLRSHRSSFDVFEVDYASVVAEPGQWTERIADFVGRELIRTPQKMAGVVRADLHRVRHAEQ
ncbi:MAG: alkaline phosphatase family protein [Chthoniobacterales bacterium]